LGLSIGRGVLHLLVRLLGLLGLLIGFPLLLFSLLLGLLIGSLLGSLLFDDLSSLVFLFLTLVVEPLNDRSCGRTQLLELGNVLSLGRVLAVLVQPVLLNVSKS